MGHYHSVSSAIFARIVKERAAHAPRPAGLHYQHNQAASARAAEIGAWLAAARLCGAITATWPEVPPQRACAAALAIEVERGAWSPTLVAAIAYHESRFDASLVNATLGACGPMQVVWSADRARQDRRCARVRRNAWAGYRAGVDKLREARRYCARRGEGDLCVLAAYASGPAGVKGRWYRGPRRVQREAARLRAAMGPRMAPPRAGKVQS